MMERINTSGTTTTTSLSSSSSSSLTPLLPCTNTTGAPAAYQDYSDVQAEDLSPSESTGGRAIFPAKLYDLLNDCYYSDEKSVYWHDHGRSFVVIDTRGFAERVMRKYFKLTQYASFLRQLSLYGFKRLEKEPDKAGYYHPKFLRGKRFLAQTIKRPSTALSSSSAAKGEDDVSDDDDDDDETCMEPNLRDYPFMPQLPPKAAHTVSEQGDDADPGTSSDESGGGGRRRQQRRRSAAGKGMQGGEDMQQSTTIDIPGAAAVPVAVGAAGSAAVSLQDDDAERNQRKRKNRAELSQEEAGAQVFLGQYPKRQQVEIREDKNGVQRNRLASMQSQLQIVPVNPPSAAVVQAPQAASPPYPAPRVAVASSVPAISFAQSANQASVALPAQGQASNETTNLPPGAIQPHLQPQSTVSLISSPGNQPTNASPYTNQAPLSLGQPTIQDALYQSVIQPLVQQSQQVTASGESISQGQSINQDAARDVALLIQQLVTGSRCQSIPQEQNTNQDVVRDVALQILQQQVSGSQGQTANQDALQRATAVCQILDQAKQTIALALGQSTGNSTTTTSGSTFQVTNQGLPAQGQASNQTTDPSSAVQLQQLLQLLGCVESTGNQLSPQTVNQPVNNLQGLMQAPTSQGLLTNQGAHQGGIPLQQLLQLSQQPGLSDAAVQLNVIPTPVNSSHVINQVPLAVTHNQTTNQNASPDSTLQLLLQLASGSTQSTANHVVSHEPANNRQVINQSTAPSHGQNTHQGTPDVGFQLQQLLQQMQQAGTLGSIPPRTGQ